MTVNFASQRCSVSDIVMVIFRRENLFKKERPERLKQVMEENARLHIEHGFDNEEMVAWNYRGWTIEGIPDQIYDDKVVEGKVVRPRSNVKMLRATAWFQGGLYARALDKPKFVIVLFKQNHEEVYVKEFVTEVEEPKIRALLDYAIDVLNSIKMLGKIGDRYVKGAWENEQLG